MSVLSIPTLRQACRILREVDYTEALPATEMSPTAGQSPRKLRTLATIEAFLQPIDDVDPENRKASVHYVNPVGLAQWVREVLGDPELGQALGTVATDGRAFGEQLHDLKRVIAERLAQSAQVMRDSAAILPDHADAAPAREAATS